MSIIPIDSIDDPRIAVFRDLPSGPPTKKSGYFVVEGAFLVERLLTSDYELASLLVDPAQKDKFAKQLHTDVPVYVADPTLLDQIIGFNFHRRALACGKRRAAQRLDDCLCKPIESTTVVVCDRIHDPENLGVVLRNCAAFGVSAVMLGPGCADPFSRRVLRVSMGSIFKLALFESQDLVEDAHRLIDDYEIELVASVLNPAADRLSGATRGDRLAVVFGNEADGVQPPLAALCRRQLTIPMQLETDSLNVGVASGIFLYHFTSCESSIRESKTKSICR